MNDKNTNNKKIECNEILKKDAPQWNKLNTEKLKEVISSFEDEITKDKENKHHRYLSWDIFHERFYKYINENKYDEDYMALNLSMYLASWGMLRGSTQLLQKYNYKINKYIIRELKKDKYKVLFNLTSLEKVEENKELISSLYIDIHNAYEEIGFTPTATLVTKIMLGSYSCMPAYDQFATLTLGQYGAQKTLNEKNVERNVINLVCLFKDIEFNKGTPIMKQIDEFLFQNGLKISESEEKN